MADDTVLQVRIDKKTKDDVEKLYRSMRFTFASAVRLFVKQSLVEQGMPFVVTKKPTNVAGKLNKYANISKRKLEKGVFERNIIAKHKKLINANIILRYIQKDNNSHFEIFSKQIL